MAGFNLPRTTTRSRSRKPIGKRTSSGRARLKCRLDRKHGAAGCAVRTINEDAGMGTEWVAGCGSRGLFSDDLFSSDGNVAEKGSAAIWGRQISAELLLRSITSPPTTDAGVEFNAAGRAVGN